MILSLLKPFIKYTSLKPLRFINNDIDHFLSLHNSRYLLGLFDIFCPKKYKGFVVLYVHHFS